MVVLLALLDRFGLGGDRWIAALVIAGGAVAAVAALVLARQVAGEVVARRAAPFVATMPAAIWIASSADALFAGVVLTGVALVALACARRDRMGDAQALLGGVLLGVALHLSYGLVLVGPLVLAVAVASRGPRVRSLAIAVIGASAVTAAFLAAGFAWWRGLLATHDAYYAGIASHRPYSYFVVANLAALAFAVGPVVAVGVARLRGALWWLVGPVLAAVAIADLSGMSKAEVERIWLFLAIPLGVATASLPAGARGRGWLAVQCAAGIVLAVTFAAGW
jgi:hypothetical protein